MNERGTSMMRQLATGLTIGTLMTLAACHRGQPGGQVAATVNGEEVTLQEINTELQNTPVPATVDKQKAERALLQRVIERKLLAGLATKKGIAGTPAYLAQKRRVDEMLLAQTYARQQMEAVQLPSQAEVAKFMQDFPGAFGQRQQLILDQIRFATPTTADALKGIETVHNLDGVAAFLGQRNIKFVRTPAALDTASVPPGLLRAVNGVPAGEPFVIPTGPVTTINVITGRKPITNDPAQAQTAAVNAWRQQKVQQMIAGQLKNARAGADIVYQPGFAPDTPPGGPAATAKP